MSVLSLRLQLDKSLMGKRKEVRLIEMLILPAFICSLILTSVFRINGFELEVFFLGVILGIGYMFFGFYLFGKPSSDHDLSYSILAGLVYSFAIMSLMFNSLGFAAGTIANIVSLVALVCLGVSLILNRRKGKMRSAYLTLHLIRSVIFLVLNIFYLFN